MRASELWPAETKFVEIGARANLLGAQLHVAGFDRYVAVARGGSQCKHPSGGHDRLTSRLVETADRRVVRHNNADVLILHGGATIAAMRFRNLRHASHVAFPLRFSLGLVVGYMACLVHAVLRRMDTPRLVHIEAGARTTRLVVFRVRRRMFPRSARHYIPHTLGLEGFLRWLTAHNVRHAVLRWFESLPRLPEGEDLDILVADEDLPRVLEMLDAQPGIEPCDVYSETGLPRSDLRRMPYYPPRLAGQLLDGAIRHGALCRVPSPHHHFLSLAYHALYHKGPASGIATRAGGRRTPRGADHDYSQILKDLAAKQQIDVELTREGLEDHLAACDWRPPRDMLVRLGKRNRWVRHQLTAQSHDSSDRGLVVFVVRREAMNRGGLTRLVPLLEQSGFSILKTKVLADHELARAANNIRGGNWGRGPWGTSGGPPAAAIVAYDPQPSSLTRRQRKKFPLADNARLLEKSRIRDALNDGYPHEQHCNVLHSSDNSAEAWDYISILMPGEEAELRRALAEWKNSYRTEAPVLKELTRYGVRAKIELVEYQGRPVVRKTFKPGRQRFCRREEWAMRELSRIVPEIPQLVHADDNSVIYPFYDDVLQYRRSSGRLIPLEAARQAIAALRKVYEAGYALIDATIDNVIVDRREGLKLIDFEFLHRYHKRPESFRDSYDIAGCPSNFEDDLPTGGGKNYQKHWMPYTGLTLDSLLNDPPWLQHAKRTLYVAMRPHRYFPRRIRQVYRLAIAVLRQPPGPEPPIVWPSADDALTTAPSELKRAA